MYISENPATESRLLIDSGADNNETDHLMYTPLMWVTQNGDVDSLASVDELPGVCR